MGIAQRWRAFFIHRENSFSISGKLTFYAAIAAVLCKLRQRTMKMSNDSDEKHVHIPGACKLAARFNFKKLIRMSANLVREP